MKYLDKKFSSPGNSKAYVDNWDAIFGEKEPAPRVKDSAEPLPEQKQGSDDRPD